jgi:hypothetical protein
LPKDDPLGQTQPKRVLWLGKENMAEANYNYFKAWIELSDQAITSPGQVAAIKAEWDLAWAAAIAAFSYIQEGRTEPR